MKKYSRRSAFTELKGFCYIAKKDDFLEVTEWHNGEGFDFSINSKEHINASLTWGEFKALKKLVKFLDEGEK